MASVLPYWQEGAAEECKSLWIGNIQPEWDEPFLAQVFASGPAQPSLIKLIRDKTTGLPAGYGFIEFASEFSAESVLNTFNGQLAPGSQLQHRPLPWVPGGRLGHGAEESKASTSTTSPTRTRPATRSPPTWRRGRSGTRPASAACCPAQPSVRAGAGLRV
jgi:hypothetical protein